MEGKVLSGWEKPLVVLELLVPILEGNQALPALPPGAAEWDSLPVFPLQPISSSPHTWNPQFPSSLEGEKPPPNLGTAGTGPHHPPVASRRDLHPTLDGPPASRAASASPAPFEAILCFPGAPRNRLSPGKDPVLAPPCGPSLLLPAPIWLWLTPHASRAGCFPSGLWHLAGGREEQGRSQRSPKLPDPEPSRAVAGPGWGWTRSCPRIPDSVSGERENP